VIVLDTNVLSALMASKPVAAVVRWLDEVPAESVWITSVTVMEVRFGLELLAPGRRRKHLEAAFAHVLDQDLQGRVLALDAAAAEVAGALAARSRAAGRTIEIRDVQIAGIVRSRKATLATRNVRHFDGLAIPIVDPWRPVAH
jgi:predicted nucleic acid-binding protein